MVQKLKKNTSDFKLPLYFFIREENRHAMRFKLLFSKYINLTRYNRASGW